MIEMTNPKTIVLVTLTLLNPLQAIVMCLAAENGVYLRTVAVMMDELVKMTVCIVILFT
jgi:hypothetical protein